MEDKEKNLDKKYEAATWIRVSSIRLIRPDRFTRFSSKTAVDAKNNEQ